MIPITVHVPESRVQEFNIRFAEFILDSPDISAPLILPTGKVPAWIRNDDAAELASRFMKEVSGPGNAVLRHLIDNARTDHPAIFTADELAAMTAHPNGKSGVAGILGGVGKAVRRAGLPMYRTPRGRTWHYVWDWDGESYSMTPEVARLLRKARG